MADYYSEVEFDFAHYGRIVKAAIRDSYKKVFLAAIFMAVIAFLFTTTLKPQYKAIAVMHVAPPSAVVFDIQELFFNRRDPAFRETQVGIMSSRVLLNKVVESLKLYENPAFTAKKSVWSVLSKEQKGQNNISIDSKVQSLSSVLQRSMFVQAQRDSYLYNMSFVFSDPQLAADVTNAWTRAYLEFVKESQEGESQESDSFLQERLAVVSKDLKSAELALQKYKENQGIVGGSEQSGGLVSQELDQVSQKLLNAKQRRLEAEAIYERIIGIESRKGSFQTLPSIKNDILHPARGVRVLPPAAPLLLSGM